MEYASARLLSSVRKKERLRARAERRGSHLAALKAKLEDLTMKWNRVAHTAWKVALALGTIGSAVLAAGAGSKWGS
jgi:hypothetical protein